MNLKAWWYTHKYPILMAVLMLALFTLISCGTGQGSAPPPPPSGPIGGGCG